MEIRHLNQERAVCGVAVTKHAPITTFLQSAIEALRTNNSDTCFDASDEQGTTHHFGESQLVAELLQYFGDMTQVVIGEAIATEDVIIFLNRCKVAWQAA